MFGGLLGVDGGGGSGMGLDVVMPVIVVMFDAE